MRSSIILAALSITMALAPGVMAKQKQPDSYTDWRTPYIEGERKLKTQELEAAESAFTQALRNVKRNKDSTADDVALCMQSLASVHYQQDRFYEKVLPLYKQVIKTLEKAHGKDSPKLAAPLSAFAGVREDEGDYKDASKLLTRALAIVEKTDGTGSLIYADYLHRLGRLNFKLGFPRKAEEMYYTSLNILMQQRVLPSGDLLDQHLIDYIDLLTKAENRGKILESAFQKELLKDSVASSERTQGVSVSTFNKEVSSRLAQPGATTLEEERIFPGGLIDVPGNSAVRNTPSLLNGAAVQSPAIIPSRQISDFAALEKINRQRVDFYKRMISTDILSLGPEHPSVARDLSGLATLYLAQKRFEEARPLLLKALAIYEKLYAPDSTMIKSTKTLLQLIEDEQNPQALANATAVADYAASLPTVPLAAQKMEVALRLNYLAFLCYCEGKLKNAEKIYSWAVASTAKAAGDQSLLAASSLFDFSRVLRSTGRQSDAETMDNTAQAILRRSISANAARSLP